MQLQVLCQPPAVPTWHPCHPTCHPSLTRSFCPLLLLPFLPSPPPVFCYILGHENGMWSIDFVKVIDDPRLVAAVDSSCAAQRKARPADEQ